MLTDQPTSPDRAPVRAPQIEPLMREHGIHRITMIRKNGLLPGIASGKIGPRDGSGTAGRRTDTARANAGSSGPGVSAPGPSETGLSETGMSAAPPRPPILLIEAGDTIIDNPEIEREILRIMETPGRAACALFDDDHIACVLTWSGKEAYLEKIDQDAILG